MASAPRRRIWLTKRALGATALIIVWVPGCALAAWWQVTVALGGNDLAYLYSVEWPVFAILGIFVWWFRVHDDPETVGRRRLLVLRATQRVQEDAVEPAQVRAYDQEDAELRAYNNYLASLAASAPPKTWRRRSKSDHSDPSASAPNTPAS